MVRIDFSQVSDMGGREPLPAGQYLCELEAIDKRVSKAGGSYWALTWIVQTGPYEGRAIWDQLFFTEKALPRVKGLCAALGVSVDGDTDLEPTDLAGRQCQVRVYEEPVSADTDSGRNRVLFDGYRPRSANGGSDDLPF